MRKLLVFALYFVRLSLLGPHPGSRRSVEPMIISRLPHAAAQRHRCIIQQDTKSAQQNNFLPLPSSCTLGKTESRKCVSRSTHLHETKNSNNKPKTKRKKQKTNPTNLSVKKKQLGGVAADTNKQTEVGIFPTSSCRFHNNNKREPTTITTNTQITSLLVLLHEAANCSLFSTTYDHNLPSTTTNKTKIPHSHQVH